MHTQEWTELVDCCNCGAAIAPRTDRAFAIDVEAFLCFGCAVQRGGAYEEATERWVVPPDSSGLGLGPG